MTSVARSMTVTPSSWPHPEATIDATSTEYTSVLESPGTTRENRNKMIDMLKTPPAEFLGLTAVGWLVDYCETHDKKDVLGLLNNLSPEKILEVYMIIQEKKANNGTPNPLDDLVNQLHVRKSIQSLLFNACLKLAASATLATNEEILRELIVLWDTFINGEEDITDEFYTDDFYAFQLFLTSGDTPKPLNEWFPKNGQKILDGMLSG